MYLGQRLIIKHENVVKEGSVVKIYPEELDIKLDDGTLVRRKFWEVRTTKGTIYEKKDETD